MLRLAAETARAERTAAAGFRSAHAADREAHGGRPSLPVHEEEADDFAQRARSRAAGVVRAVHGLEHGGVPDPDEGPLSELRPGAPGDDSVRILFTAGPDGSATLHEAGADEADWDRWYVTALPRARRERTSPETSAAYTEQGFLAAFFSGLEAEVAAAADELSDRRGARALHAVRRAAGVSRSDVALRMNVAAEEVAALERDGLGAADLGSLTAYAEALGGRIEVTAEFGGRKVALR